MCGRYGYINNHQQSVKKSFRLKKIPPHMLPRYNMTPGQNVPVILNEAPEELQLARWGLIPSWAKDEKIGHNMINARAETIFEKPSYRHPIRKKRCLILADFFFEWKKSAKGPKQPYCIRLKSEESFAFAGIWDCWQEELVSCSIVTIQPNTLMQPIHDRMPVILRKEDEEAWLKEDDSDAIKRLLKPFSATDMRAYPVSTYVNSPQHDDKQVLAEASLE